MDAQKKWYEQGMEAAEAARAFLDFEKTSKPMIEAKIREHDDLEDRAEKLSAKLNRERVDFDTKRSALFRDLGERRTRLLSDLRARAGRPATGSRAQFDEDFDAAEIVGQLLPKAKTAAKEIRERGLAVLHLERELAEARLQSSIVASWPGLARCEAARNFVLALFSVAGISFRNQQLIFSLDETKRWTDRLRQIDQKLAFMEGHTKSDTVGYFATSADDVLSFAAQLPEAALGQLVEAWATAAREGAAKVALSYYDDGSLRWRINKPKHELSRVSTRDLHDYDVSGGSKGERTPARA